MRKSPCCAAVVRRFAGRRRQCAACLKTWRIRPRKRGRPALRSDSRLIHRVLIQRRNLTEIARRRKRTRQALSRRFTKTLQSHLLRSRVVSVASEDAILLVDGLWFRFKRTPWVLYLMALRPVNAETATFIDPVLIEGPERMQAWKNALATIPREQRQSIRALVGDKFHGCRTIADENGWILQLCHFHLLGPLSQRLGRRRPNLVARILRQEAYKLLKKAIRTVDSKQLGTILYCLKELMSEPAMPVYFKQCIRTFLRHPNDYHAYLRYPSLRLPCTNNSTEAMGRRVRDLLRQTRGLRSPKALKLWATQHIRMHPHIACRATQLSTN
jgi:hypothetical protein